ncbi:hypothetical protein TNCV_4597981 [Trichonephila clavipes]|nr:hypothetical protein TNCV_4597981 [Trichonephila clavipes]
MATHLQGETYFPVPNTKPAFDGNRCRGKSNISIGVRKWRSLSFTLPSLERDKHGYPRNATAKSLLEEDQYPSQQERCHLNKSRSYQASEDSRQTSRGD